MQYKIPHMISFGSTCLINDFCEIKKYLDGFVTGIICPAHTFFGFFGFT